MAETTGSRGEAVGRRLTEARVRQEVKTLSGIKSGRRRSSECGWPVVTRHQHRQLGQNFSLRNKIQTRMLLTVSPPQGWEQLGGEVNHSDPPQSRSTAE
ncbi:hypothetical protein EYF80_043150 [Liparis tanakae]|uniref:Uncharacterized protein n=1 Tax=Liparis tanakae TaxID=230148 RepID=A0A4Z2G0A0_9TELE|nr:hypothetical protein EYF80_043150 [Liparis tanakae]